MTVVENAGVENVAPGSGVENAGVENVAPDDRGGKHGIGKRGSRMCFGGEVKG